MRSFANHDLNRVPKLNSRLTRLHENVKHILLNVAWGKGSGDADDPYRLLWIDLISSRCLDGSYLLHDSKFVSSLLSEILSKSGFSLSSIGLVRSLSLSGVFSHLEHADDLRDILANNRYNKDLYAVACLEERVGQKLSPIAPPATVPFEMAGGMYKCCITLGEAIAMDPVPAVSRQFSLQQTRPATFSPSFPPAVSSWSNPSQKNLDTPVDLSKAFSFPGNTAKQDQPPRQSDFPSLLSVFATPPSAPPNFTSNLSSSTAAATKAMNKPQENDPNPFKFAGTATPAFFGPPPTPFS